MKNSGEKIITMSTLGNNGRLGNFLFQYAFLLGISLRFLNVKLQLPGVRYAGYFKNQKEVELFIPPEVGVVNLVEQKFEYDPELFEIRLLNELEYAADFKGYFQSYKYWWGVKDQIKEAFQFKDEYVEAVKHGVGDVFKKKTIAIHMRRGDYVGNDNYVQLSMTYYLTALQKHFWEGLHEFNLVIFSDHIEYAKVHFQGLPNVYFSEGQSEVEDLILMSQCDHFIIANSTFSWWAALLGQKKYSKIIYPSKYFDGELADRCSTVDFWPPDWTECAVDERIDLMDMTFMIPVTFDHQDRKNNLSTCLIHLEKYFDTNISVLEHEATHFADQVKAHNVNYAGYGYMPDMPFHRTHMLNVMAVEASTPFIAHWDADVLVPPLQILLAVERLRAGTPMVYPYDGIFAKIPKTVLHHFLNTTGDLGIVMGTLFEGMQPEAKVSVGGAVMFRKNDFIEGGMENENFITFAPEDQERYYRFKTLGYRIDRIEGVLYHLEHFRGANSTLVHQYVSDNTQEWLKVKAMNQQQLRDYVATWAWKNVPTNG